MYLAQLLAVLGHTLWFGSPMLVLYLMNYAIAVYLIATLYEEPLLLREFDSDYERYHQNVPAWIPRLTPYKPDDYSRPANKSAANQTTPK